MKGRSALPRAAFLLGLLVVVGGIAGSMWGLKLLAGIDYFNVRRVEVVGTRWLAPDSLLRMAAIGSDRSVWEDYAHVEHWLVTHPLIEEAQVRRSGLHALRIVVREVEPVALVGVPELRAVRDNGTLLPIDLAGTSLDLPLLTMPVEVAADSTTLRESAALSALEIFVTLRRMDPGLAAIVSDFRQLEDDGLILNLAVSQPAKRLALPAEIDEALARRVRATLADLRHRDIDAAFVEARYAGQIVVRRGKL
jgi:cell division septal protein FtsQ